MKHLSILAGVTAAVAAIGLAPAFAASADYFLKLDGVDGEAAASRPIDIESWSFGVCPNGRCTTLANRSQHRAAPRPTLTISGSNMAAQRAADPPVGDLDGDGAPDLGYAAQVSEVTGLTLHLATASPALLKVCAGKHIAKAELQRGGGDSLIISDATITCSAGSSAGDAGKPSVAAGTVPRSTQGATFGERVNAGLKPGAAVTVTFASGKIHTRTGHVTLMK